MSACPVDPVLAGPPASPSATASGSPPGPRLPKLLQSVVIAPQLGNRLLWACTRRYGKTFRLNVLGPYEDCVITSDVELIEQILVADKEADIAAWRPRGSLIRMIGNNPFLRTDGEEHKHYRRQLSGPFRQLTQLQKVDNELRDRVRRAFAELPTGRKAGLWEIFEPIIFDRVLHDALGVEDPDMRDRLRAATDEFYERGYRLRMIDPWLFARSRGSRLRREFDTLERVLDTLLNEELQRPSDAPFRVALRTSAADWGAKHGMSELAMSVEYFKGVIHGAHHSTAAGAVWTLMLLLHHPSILSELRARVADGDSKFLDQCIREAFRVVPPFPLSVAKRVTRPIGSAGVQIPPGTALVVAISLVHRDPELYSEPQRFDPHRYDNGWQPHPVGWLPFGFGLHRCLGTQWSLQRIADVIRVALEFPEMMPARARMESQTLVADARIPRHGGEIVKLASRARQPEPLATLA